MFIAIFCRILFWKCLKTNGLKKYQLKRSKLSLSSLWSQEKGKWRLQIRSSKYRHTRLDLQKLLARSRVRVESKIGASAKNLARPDSRFEIRDWDFEDYLEKWQKIVVKGAKKFPEFQTRVIISGYIYFIHSARTSKQNPAILVSWKNASTSRHTFLETKCPEMESPIIASLYPRSIFANKEFQCKI